MKPPIPRKASLLIIYDHPNNLHTLDQILSDNDYQVRTAINEQLGINAVLSAPPNFKNKLLTNYLQDKDN